MSGGPIGRADDLIGRAATWLVRLGSAVLAVMMLMTFFDVIGRYVFSAPLVGTVESTELFMGLIVYFGVGYTTWERGHISVDVVVSRLAPEIRRWLDLFADFVSTGFVALLSWRLWIMAEERLTNNDITQVWEMPVYPVAYAMAAASVLMVVAFALHLVRTAIGLGARARQ